MPTTICYASTIQSHVPFENRLIYRSDLTTQWLEKGKNCVPDTRTSNLSSTTTPAYRPYIGAGSVNGGGSGSAAPSCSMVTVTRLTSNNRSATSVAAAAAAQAAKNKRNGMKPHRRLPPPPYVKLAEENPSAFGENCDSDTSSMYDSFNENETGSYHMNTCTD